MADSEDLKQESTATTSTSTSTPAPVVSTHTPSSSDSAGSVDSVASVRSSAFLQVVAQLDQLSIREMQLVQKALRKLRVQRTYFEGIDKMADWIPDNYSECVQKITVLDDKPDQRSALGGVRIIKMRVTGIQQPLKLKYWAGACCCARAVENASGFKIQIGDQQWILTLEDEDDKFVKQEGSDKDGPAVLQLLHDVLHVPHQDTAQLICLLFCGYASFDEIEQVPSLEDILLLLSD